MLPFSRRAAHEGFFSPSLNACVRPHHTFPCITRLSSFQRLCACTSSPSYARSSHTAGVYVCEAAHLPLATLPTPLRQRHRFEEEPPDEEGLEEAWEAEERYQKELAQEALSARSPAAERADNTAAGPTLSEERRQNEWTTPQDKQALRHEARRDRARLLWVRAQKVAMRTCVLTPCHASMLTTQRT